MNKIYLLAATIFAASSVQAENIPLPNGDFEATTQNYFGGFDPTPDTTPGWANYGTIADGGVENNGWWGCYNNGRSAFIVNGTGAYNTSAYTIKAGDVFNVGFVGKSWSGAGSQIKVTLFYNEPGTPGAPLNVIGTFTQDVTGTYTPYVSVPIGATAGSVGGTLGVIIEKTGSNVIAFDEVTLSVSTATPEITFTQQPPESVSKFVGESLTLSASAVSSDQIAFQWQKSTNGGTTWANVDGATAASYSFSPSYADTGAQFRLNATNTSGTVASTVSTLTVSYPAPTVTKNLLGHTVLPGTTGDVTLTAEATGLGSLTFTWSKDGVVIPGATSGSLTVSARTVADTATYTLVIADDAAAAMSSLPPMTATLTAQVAVVDPAATTVAYYRFEEGVDGDGLASAADSVGANTMTGVGSPNYTAYSSNVPAATVPKTGASNTLSSSFPAGGFNALVAPIDHTLATTTFTDFTIECYVQFDDLDQWQTMVGRDDSGAPGQGAGDTSLFYLQKMGDGTNRIRALFNTATGNDLEVTSGSVIPDAGTWYHVAVVGDSIAGTCTLYINGTVVGSATGFPGLRVPTADSSGTPGTPWTIGRGQYGGGPGDYVHGYVDEVRFSRVALPVSKFLLSPNVVLTAQQTWRQTHFGTTEATGNAADNADPDADGVVNLLEYALAGDPMVAEHDLLPLQSVQAGHLTLSFDRIADQTLTYEVLASNDLATWTSVWSSTGNANVAGPVTAADPELLSAHARRFLRLRVTAP